VARIWLVTRASEQLKQAAQRGAGGAKLACFSRLGARSSDKWRPTVCLTRISRLADCCPDARRASRRRVASWKTQFQLLASYISESSASSRNTPRFLV